MHFSLNFSTHTYTFVNPSLKQSFSSTAKLSHTVLSVDSRLDLSETVFLTADIMQHLMGFPPCYACLSRALGLMASDRLLLLSERSCPMWADPRVLILLPTLYCKTSVETRQSSVEVDHGGKANFKTTYLMILKEGSSLFIFCWIFFAEWFVFRGILQHNWQKKKYLYF